MSNERKNGLLNSKTNLILNAYRELDMARKAGDEKSVKAWEEAVNRLLDEYIDERRESDDDGSR